MLQEQNTGLISLHSSISFSIGIFVVFGLLLIAGLVLLVMLRHFIASEKIRKTYNFFESNAVYFSLLLILFSIFGSLFYSNVYLGGLAPCTLCWYERILLYPQALFIIVAMFKNRLKEIIDYLLPLNVLGVIVSGYHVLLQRTNLISQLNMPQACDATIGNCSSLLIQPIFGFITIPVMSLVAFLLLTVFMLYAKKCFWCLTPNKMDTFKQTKLSAGSMNKKKRTKMETTKSAKKQMKSKKTTSTVKRKTVKKTSTKKTSKKK